MEGLWQGGVWDLGAPSREIGVRIWGLRPSAPREAQPGSEGSGWGAAGKNCWKLLEIA